MPLTDPELVKRFKLTPKMKILDVGGSMKQHSEINVHTLADILHPEESHYNKGKLLAERFARVDFNRDKLPFKDKEFDFCLCTHTLEDLPYPFLLIDEMERVAKAGYIATPSMGKDITYTPLDMTNWGTGVRRVPGISHHKWLFYMKKGVMQVVPKNYPLLYSSEFQFTAWIGEEEFQYAWKGKIFYKEITDINFPELIKVYRSFIKANKRKLKKGVALTYFDNPVIIGKQLVKRILGK